MSVTLEIPCTPSAPSAPATAASTPAYATSSAAGSPGSPTPTQMPLGSSPTARNATAGRQPGSQHHAGTTLSDAIVLLPTPAAADGERTSPTYVRGNPTLAGALLPTPKVRDARSLGRAEVERKSPGLGAVLLPTPTRHDGASGPGHDGRQGAPNLRTVAPLLLPTPRATDGTKDGPNQHGSSGDLMLPSAVQPGRWGRWAAAVARWEAILGRPAPDPTEPRPVTMKSLRACAEEWGVDGWAAREAIRAGWWGARLAPPFVEWMMGAGPGHVTAVPGVSRSAQLARLGNGVVPQQAAAAVRLLLGGAA